jgi:DNA modification methylase
MDPFAGIGSVLHEGISLDRYVIGIELKAEYFFQACQIAQKAAKAAKQLSLL